MNFLVTLLQNLPARTPIAVQARYQLADGSVQTWPVTVHAPRDGRSLTVESEREMLVPDARTRSLVGHYPTPPTREERQISAVRRPADEPDGQPAGG